MPDSTGAGSTRVVIIDDHVVFAESLSRLLASESDLVVVGVASTAADGIAIVTQTRPDVVLIDYQMPDQNGVLATRQIKSTDARIKVVMLTGSADDSVLVAAIEAGCSGFITKDQAASSVTDAVRAAAAGEAVISPAMLVRLLPRLNGTHVGIGADLTEREREVLSLVARGLANKEIAAELFLSVNTIRNYVQSILDKLGAHSKLEAVATAVREGLVEYPRG